MEFVPSSRCGVPWCRAAHLPADKPGHAAQLALWNIGATSVEIFIGQVDPNPPIVRLTRMSAQGRRTRDVDPEFAAELADILDALPGRTRELIAALRAASEALGP